MPTKERSKLFSGNLIRSREEMETVMALAMGMLENIATDISILIGQRTGNKSSEAAA
jgi:hypothetical protein